MNGQRIRQLAVPLLFIVGVPILYWLVYGPPYLNYDASYSLLWARDIAHGFTPDYNGFIAPTPHPLQTFASFLALPFGDYTTGVLAWLVMLCFGGLCFVVYRIGKELFNDWVGVLAAIIIITRPAFAKNVLAAYQDIPFILFVCWALLLEIRKPRRGAPVLVLLALAGLLRPEAWLLSGLYWLWMWPARDMRGRVLLALVVGSAPILWAISDWAITGDLLHSFHGTSDLAAQLDRPRSPFVAPFWTLKFFAWTLREPLMVGVPIGLVYCWFCARRQGLILFGLATLMSLIFILTTVGGLPLIARYVLTPTVLLSVIYAAGCFGWKSLEGDFPRREMWKWIGWGSLALSIAFIPWFIPIAQDNARKIHNYQSIQGDLREVAQSSTVEKYNRLCGRISTTDHRPVPAFRYELGGQPGSVQTTGDPETKLAALALFPASQDIVNRFYSQKKPDLSTPTDADGDPYEVVFSTWAWKLYASPACVAAVKRGEKLEGAEKAGDEQYGPGGAAVPL
ncbi:MAG: glycosyltransferase family 39 protein [Solirubrobacterales bacterium]